MPRALPQAFWVRRARTAPWPTPRGTARPLTPQYQNLDSGTTQWENPLDFKCREWYRKEVQIAEAELEIKRREQAIEAVHTDAKKRKQQVGAARAAPRTARARPVRLTAPLGAPRGICRARARPARSRAAGGVQLTKQVQAVRKETATLRFNVNQRREQLEELKAKVTKLESQLSTRLRPEERERYSRKNSTDQLLQPAGYRGVGTRRRASSSDVLAAAVEEEGGVRRRLSKRSSTGSMSGAGAAAAGGRGGGAGGARLSAVVETGGAAEQEAAGGVGAGGGLLPAIGGAGGASAAAVGGSAPVAVISPGAASRYGKPSL